MAFIRAWDKTFPPDTQQANLLGQDIRRDKEDTAERIRAFGGGVIGSRETPEADFGNANIGALFFAEDEGKLYRWNGTTWNRILIQRNFADAGPATKATTGAEQDMLTVTIPANTLAVGDILEVSYAVIDPANDGGAPRQLLSFNGATVLNVLHNPHATVVGFAYLFAKIRVQSATEVAVTAFGHSDTIDSQDTPVLFSLVAINLASAIVVKSVLGTGGTGNNITHRNLILTVR